MFQATDTPWAPWYVARSDDKKRMRLNVIQHILDHVPYEKLESKPVKLTKRDEPKDYRDPKYPFKYVEEKY